MKSTILIVDDESSARETICAILDGSDYHLELTENGSQAILMAKKTNPDLILLDVMMPEMDGFEVCRQLRADPFLREVPILLLTSLDDRASRLSGLRAGADDFLSKPIDPQELRARVNTITRLNRYRTLVEQRENLKEMAGRVIQAQEQERLRISREIHDDIGQALTVQQIQLKFLYDRIPEEQADLRQTVQELLHETANTFDKLRLLAQDLRPPLLDTLGVVMALKAYCSDFSRRTRLPAHFEADDEVPEIPDTIGVTLYRVLQEALSNLARHAQASQAWVTLNVDDEEICLTVQDDGIGISGQEEGQKGLGLQGMRERVTLAGGSFHLHSAPGQGTVITARFVRQSQKSSSKARPE